MKQFSPNPNNLTFTPEFEEKSKVFGEHFDDGRLEVVNMADLPKNIIKRFNDRASNLVPLEETPKPITETFYIAHNNGDVSYVARHQKDYDHAEMSEELLYVVETRGGEEIGHAEIAYRTITPKEDTYTYRPYIAFIKTKEPYRNQGLGTRKVLMMNALSWMEFNKPLYAGGPNSDEMISIWQQLVELGSAEKFIEDGHEKYVFKT